MKDKKNGAHNGRIICDVLHTQTHIMAVKAARITANGMKQKERNRKRKKIAFPDVMRFILKLIDVIWLGMSESIFVAHWIVIHSLMAVLCIFSGKIRGVRTIFRKYTCVSDMKRRK